MSEVEGGEFTLVKRKGGRNPRVTRLGISPTSTAADLPDVRLDRETARRRIEAARADLERSDYYRSFAYALDEALSAAGASKDSVVEILCFGLGHIGECIVSRYQLALALCLRDRPSAGARLLAHDPVFYADECRVLRELGVELIRDNEEGRRRLPDDGFTVVYMPHCPRRLTDNFLAANWSCAALRRCALVCNSFTATVESRRHDELERQAPHVLDVLPYAREFSVVNSFKYHDAFNDTAVHAFPESALSLVTDNFWAKRSRGDRAEEDDVELITRRVASALMVHD